MRIFIFLCLCLFLLQCQKKQEENKKDPIPVKKETKKVEEKVVKKQLKNETDTINRKNTVAFLEAFGKKNPETIVLMETRLGNIKVRLYKDTPLHRANFIFLTKMKYFDTTCFHRIVPDFIVQAGNSDHPFTQKARMKYKNYTLPAEILPHRKHKYGALAAARDWDNNPKKRSSAFEFYMIQDKRGSHHLDGEHTIFGEIIQGFNTMEKIAKLKTDSKEWPINDVYIKASVIK